MLSSIVILLASSPHSCSLPMLSYVPPAVNVEDPVSVECGSLPDDRYLIIQTNEEMNEHDLRLRLISAGGGLDYPVGYGFGCPNNSRWTQAGGGFPGWFQCTHNPSGRIVMGWILIGVNECQTSSPFSGVPCQPGSGTLELVLENKCDDSTAAPCATPANLELFVTDSPLDAAGKPQALEWLATVDVTSVGLDAPGSTVTTEHTIQPGLITGTPRYIVIGRSDAPQGATNLRIQSVSVEP